MDQALMIFKKVLGQRRRISSDDAQELSLAMENVGNCLLRLKKWAEAEPVLRECLKIRKTKMPDQLITFETMRLLGTSLHKQEQYVEAETLLIQAHTGLSQGKRENLDSERQQSIDNSRRQLVDLYKDWGKPDEASKWDRRK